MAFEGATRHGGIAVGRVGADDSQLVQYLPHQDASLTNVVLSQWLTVGWTDAVATNLVSNASVAERVSTWSIHWVYQWLEADLAHKIIVYLDGIVVEMVASSLVTLSTTVADHDVSSLQFEAIRSCHAAAGLLPLPLMVMVVMGRCPSQ